MAHNRDSYEYTATGVLGEQRNTMFENPLHLRSELGRPLRRGYTDYPGDKWRYGQPYPPSNGGVADALGTWATLPGLSKSYAGESGGERDFMALNREATKLGLVKPHEQYQYRATHDIRRKPQTARDNSPRGTVRRLPPSHVYGISTRPSTPIHDLLENKYQGQWIKEMRAAEVAHRQQVQAATMSPAIETTIKANKVHETRASMLRQYQVPVQSAPLWKMPKFTKNAQPALLTFRDDRQKSSAYNHAQTDRIARQGVEGAGVYVPACN